MNKIENPALQAAAHQVARAEAEVDRTLQPLAAANAQCDRLQARLAELDRQCATLLARRQAGEVHADDASSLSLIDADRAGLSELLREADDAVAAARKPHEDAKNALASARYQLGRAEAEAEEAALVAHAGQLESRVLETVRRLDDVRKRLGGGRPAWAPSPAIVGEFNRLRLQKGPA